ncbi:hypothetical protein C8R44DRAFT_859850 [Mycena epipterygia]|nr:hypothetical protein C8R44DRAFT_859850 [Mycena epipterygia]
MDKKDTVDPSSAAVAPKDAVDAKNVRPNATRSDENREDVIGKEKIAKERDPDSTKQRVGQLERPARICGCACQIDCNCNCTCACRDHCKCSKDSCQGKCGDKLSRNLVVSIDGTSNQFGVYNTNVVELHSRIDPKNQSKYYNCGIGTYVPDEAKATFKYVGQWIDNTIDLAIARNFKNIILEAYKWLSTTYQPGDKIFIFGFSRGAHQARTLAAMIEKVGLVDTGNESMIPFAYEIYLERHKGKVLQDEKKEEEEKEGAEGEEKEEGEQEQEEQEETEEEDQEQATFAGGRAKKAEHIARNFKNTFSREVRIHFAGLWDTVSSVGLVRGKPLPLTSSAQHICIFRHALALDERRVKFLPEYVDGGGSAQQSDPKFTSFDVKEVWFPGTHSDIGGGIKKNGNLNLSTVPLMWMENEATLAGLRLLPRKSGGAWETRDLRKKDIHKSLKGVWWPLEYLPLSRLSFKTPHKVTRTPHRGAGRIIAPGQRVHISVAFKKDYHPRATFLEPDGIEWDSFVGKNVETTDFDWVDRLGNKVEKELFDSSFMIQAVESLRVLWDTQHTTSGNKSKADETKETYLIQRLAFMALSGHLAVTYLSMLEQNSSKKDNSSMQDNLSKEKPSNDTEVSNVVDVFQKLRKQRVTFDADLAALLEHKAGLLIAGGNIQEGLVESREAQTIRLDIARRAKASPRAIDVLDTSHRAGVDR